MSGRASVSMRFSGERFHPGDISHLLSVGPTMSYVKGETYSFGRANQQRTAPKTLWLVDFGAHEPEPSINDQIDRCFKILISARPLDRGPARRDMLPRYIEKFKLKFTVSVYYFAPINDHRELYLDPLENLVEQIGGRFEQDIDRETAEDLRHNRRIHA